MLTYGGHGAETVGLLLLALVLDAVFGELPWLFRFVSHPVVVIGRLVAFFDRRLNRIERSNRTRLFRGGLTVAILVALAAAIGSGIHWVVVTLPFAWFFELLLITALVAQRSLYDHVAAVRVALDESGIAAGREAVSHIVGRDPDALDHHGVCRAAIESLAENFSDGVVAPVLWTLLFGLPGLLVYKTINTLDSMIGHKTPRHLYFGKVAARLDDAANWIPARISGLILMLAALVAPGARPWVALKTMWRDAGKHKSPNAGWPEAAVAGALDLALAGPRRYPETVVNDPWIGEGRARATTADIGAALRLYVIACLIDAALVAAALVALLWATLT
ncbi:MAG: cobalamin biosynthesis protein CobD [Alphaproteobacteria bacterium]|nr:cobalamin biosynthesis protein CobD [Alphaproteobacteria bacterium]